MLQDASVAAGTLPLVNLRPTVLYNPDLVSRNYMVPGILGLIIMIMTMMLTAMAVVRESELGTMEQLLVTPLTPGQLIVGKLVPYALVGLVEVFTVLPVVLFWFRVPLRGSFLTLLLLTLPYMLCTLGLGLFISTLAQTQQQAMMLSAFVFILPQMLLSGFAFPIQNMPAVLPGGHLPRAAALLPRHPARRVPQGCGPLGAVAAGARPSGDGHGDPRARPVAFPETARVDVSEQECLDGRRLWTVRRCVLPSEECL